MLFDLFWLPMKQNDKKNLAIIGSSGHAKVIIDIVEKQNKLHILGLFDDFRDTGAMTAGYTVLGGIKDIGAHLKKHPNLFIFIAVGANWVRQSIVEELDMYAIPRERFASVIHPSSNISNHVEIGQGVAIMAGATVNSHTVIGDFTIINSNSSVDHDCKISDYASIAPNAVLGGNVSVGQLSAVNIGATVINNICIGASTVIGAGAVVVKDCGDYEVHYGVPATFIRNRKLDDAYL